MQQSSRISLALPFAPSLSLSSPHANITEQATCREYEYSHACVCVSIQTALAHKYK